MPYLSEVDFRTSGASWHWDGIANLEVAGQFQVTSYHCQTVYMRQRKLYTTIIDACFLSSSSSSRPPSIAITILLPIWHLLLAKHSSNILLMIALVRRTERVLGRE
jgi:hypothetical protein